MQFVEQESLCLHCTGAGRPESVLLCGLGGGVGGQIECWDNFQIWSKCYSFSRRDLHKEGQTTKVYFATTVRDLKNVTTNYVL